MTAIRIGFTYRNLPQKKPFNGMVGPLSQTIAEDAKRKKKSRRITI